MTARTPTDVFDSIARAADAAPAAPGTRIIWARDFDPMLDIEYSVDGLIAKQEIVAVYGAPKCGKTFIVTELAGCVSTGRPFFGMQTTSGLVIYVASEMGERAQRRGVAWMRHNLGEQEDRNLPFGIIPRPVNLMDATEVERLAVNLREWVAERGELQLLIIDTLARSLAGGDENSAQDLGIAVAAATSLRDEFKCAVVVVHHIGKNPEKGMRGSNALLGAVDLALRVESGEAGRCLIVADARDLPDGARFGFKLELIQLGTTPRGVVITSCAVVPSAAPPPAAADVARRAPREPTGSVQRIVLRVLREVIAEHGVDVPATSTLPPNTRWVPQEKLFIRAIPSMPGEPAAWKARATIKRALQSLDANRFIGSQAGHLWIFR
jgi:KaiC/GvpD/RAD55 family RecA-like ATPase